MYSINDIIPNIIQRGGSIDYTNVVIIILLVFIIIILIAHFLKTVMPNIMPTSEDKNKVIIENEILPPRDVLKDMDYKVMGDPLTEATRRPPRHVIGPVINSPYFNYPTRGYTDSYSLKGYLIDETATDNKDKFIKLFGREKYPNSTEWEYYVSINTGIDDNIKYTLDKQRKELWDGDNVYIDLLGKNYKAKILKQKTFEYNPYEF
jgi:hypothetical protein